MNNHPGKIVIDLDGVIAGPKPETGYADCEINGLVAQRLRELKALGWTIAIHSSRNVKSFEHNVGRITAETVPLIAEFLTRNDVPYDEIWPNKPWTGNVGFYVDDRAVRPQEFVELTISELLTQARGAFYDPAKPAWRAGNEQRWFVADLRKNPSPLFRGELLALIDAQRELGLRAAIILPPFITISPGQDEELHRRGARWWRFIHGPETRELVKHVQRELVLDNLTVAHEPLQVIEVTSSDNGTLSSRHFNTVEAYGGRVLKKADTEATKRKLRFECEWLQAVSRACGSPSLVIGGVTPRYNEDGYIMEQALGGSLSTALLRRNLTELEVSFVADELRRLWTDLNNHNPKLVSANTRQALASELKREHEQLYTVKSKQRVDVLSHLLHQAGAGDSNNYRWTINGVRGSTIYDTVQRLLALIPVSDIGHRGVWHGDFCPGNMVLTCDIAEDDAAVLLIDPRGTINDHDVSFYGDRRYDLAKLTHSLRWGYDAILVGWRDVFWTADVGELSVRLRVWDEESNVRPGRFRVWDDLLGMSTLGAGAACLDSPVIKAITALQLITCAPLHKEDPARMIALVARGMQIARELEEETLKSV